MKYLTSYCTDIGIKKSVNQDSLCVKKANTPNGEVALAVLCDGMGGLSKGEIASANGVMEFADWFADEFPKVVDSFTEKEIVSQWREIIFSYNDRLYRYGLENGFQLGTTLTVVLLLWDGRYVIAHVGDSRAYHISHKKMTQITEDQSLVAREVKMKRLTREDAKNDPRRNVLLECVGVTERVEVLFYSGKVKKDDKILMCSDGFRHMVEESEMLKAILSKENREEMQLVLRDLIDRNKSRGETDNITAILVDAV